MDTRLTQMNPEQAAAALRWLSEMGADEIVGDSPVNRLAARSENAASRGGASPIEQRRQTVPPTPAPSPTSAPSLTAGRSVTDCVSLPDIAAALEAFDGCPLKKTATRLCYADGNPSARVMLVGEAPGRDEDIEGRPFVGQSGQLLDRMLAAIGLSRHADDPEQAVFITNTVFWRPPGNRTPTSSETQMCLPFLIRTIELQKPDVIVCLGATPAERLTGRTDGILKLRGAWLSTTISERKIPVLPTLHPAYLLRQPSNKRLAWRDLLSLRQMLDAH